MVWKNFEEMTSSDIATNYFQTLLELVRASDSPILYCHLKEKINSVPVPGIVMDEGSSKVVRAKIQRPLSADFLFSVEDQERKEIGLVELVHTSRELDDDNQFMGYDADFKSGLEHQTGLRLRHLMPLNRLLYFLNDLRFKNYVEVDDGLIYSLLNPHFKSKLDTLEVKLL